MVDMDLNRPNVDMKSVSANTTLDSATSRLVTTQQNFTNIQQRYDKSTELSVDQEKKLAHIGAQSLKLLTLNYAMVSPPLLLSEVVAKAYNPVI